MQGKATSIESIIGSCISRDSVKQIMKKSLAVHHRAEAQKSHVHPGGIFLFSGTRVMNYVNRFKDLAALVSAEKCT